jgi:lactoylglutathione lyase
MELDDHPRQHEERLAPRHESAGDPAVRVREVAEARQVALEACQVLEIGRRRHEECVDPALLEQRCEPLSPRRVFFGLDRHDDRRIARMELIHTCYRITDIDRSVAFYTALGFEERRRMPIREEAINVFMGLPGDGDRLELTYNFGVDSYELGTGYGHIAVTVDDMKGTLEELAQQAIYPEREPYQVREGGNFICFVRDPDGYRVELIERNPPA